MIGTPVSEQGALVYRWPAATLGAGEQLTVDGHQVAVLRWEGRVLGAIGPGRYSLDPASLPALASADGPPYQIDLCFVSVAEHRGIMFGGRAGGLVDPASGSPAEPVFTGSCALRVVDPAKLVSGLVDVSTGNLTGTVLSLVKDRVGLAVKTALGRFLGQGRSLPAIASDPSVLISEVQRECGNLSAYGLELEAIERLSVVAPQGLGAEGGGAPDQERVYEMLWDCKYCGQRKNLGLTHRCCPNCGAPQDPAGRYFPADDEKVAVEDHPYVGADVACPACREANSRACKHCRSCGSPLGAGVAVAIRADQVHALGGFAGDSAQAARAEFAQGPTPARAPEPGKRKGRVALLAGVGCLGVVVVVVALFVVFLMFRQPAALEVAGRSWERSIQIERYGRVRESAWCDQVPAGARVISRQREQRSTEKIKDGEECKTRKKDRGDGTFKETRECTPKYRERPVMDDRCSIEVAKWTTSRTETARGSSANEPPRWPATNITRTGSVEGSEREGARQEKYQVTFRDPQNGKTHECTFPEAKWKSLVQGQRHQGQISQLTGSLDCGSLVAASK